MRTFSLPRIVAAAALLAIIGCWYFFRPERLFIDRRVDEPAPAAVERVLLTGSFEPRAHEGRGRVDVLDLGSGHRVVRISDFETSDGPDLHVYLLGAAEAANTDDLNRAGFVALGALKGNVGPQNYAIPDETDLKRYRAVSASGRLIFANVSGKLCAESARANSSPSALTRCIACARGRRPAQRHGLAGSTRPRCAHERDDGFARTRETLPERCQRNVQNPAAPPRGVISL